MNAHHKDERHPYLYTRPDAEEDVRGHSTSVGDSIGRAAGTVLSTGAIGGIGSSLTGVDWGKIARDLIK